MRNKIISLILAALLCFSIFAGCASTDKDKDRTQDEAGDRDDIASEDRPVELIYYTIGTPPADLNMVTEKLAELTVDRINARAKLIFVDWGDYGSKITAIINSGEEFDLAYAAGPDQGNYLGNSQKGAFAPLDELLQEYGQGILEIAHPASWEGLKVDGKIYGIPTKGREVAAPNNWMYPKELVDKYDIDIDNIKTFEDLEPWLDQLSQQEPSWQLMDLDQDSYFYPGYERIVESVPVGIAKDSENLTVRNLYEEEPIIEILHILRKFYKAGYINQDAAIKPPSGLVKGEKVFWKQAQGGPGADIIWSKDRGYPIVTSQIEDAYISTSSTREAVVCVSANSKHKEEAVEYINLINTDADVRNLLGYGIEDVHYELIDDRVSFLEESSNYAVPNYSLGNQSIMYLKEDDPADLREREEAVIDSAIESPILGFTPNLNPIRNEIAAITNVGKEYIPGLMTGSVDIEENLAKFNDKLKEAGIDRVIEELQSQIDEWSENKG